MSYSDGDRRDDRRRRDRDRDRDRHDHRTRSPVYEEEEIIRARRGPKGAGGGAVAGAAKRRGSGSSSDSSVEEVKRSFPPGAGGYDRRRGDFGGNGNRARKDRNGGRDRMYNDRKGGADYDDRAPRNSRRSRHRGHSRSSSSSYTSRSSSSYSSRRSSRREKDHRKSLGEQALAALGIGGAAGALAGRSKSRDRSRDRDYRDRGRGNDYRNGRDRRSRHYYGSSSSRSRSRSRNRGKKGGDPREKVIQAARAAVLAGGAEAWRMRNEPGGWGGPKGKRVLTAAVGAAGIDGLLDKDPNKNGVRHTIEAVIGGLAGNRIINGSRKDDEDLSPSRSRSRSRNRDGGGGGGGGGFGALGAGALAAGAASAAKAFSNRNKNSDNRRRDYSSSSDDGRRRGGGAGNKTVSDLKHGFLGALGFGGNKAQRDTGDRSPPHGRRDSSTSTRSSPFSSSLSSSLPTRAGGRERGQTVQLREASMPRGPQGWQYPLAPYNAEHPRHPPYDNHDPKYETSNYHPALSRIASHLHGTSHWQPMHAHRGDFGGDIDIDDDDVSSTEEERERKAMGNKALVTAGLASVATIHAAHSIYQSMNLAELRKKKVREGNLSRADARKRKHKKQLQNAATLGIAALGVKGAYSEWKEMKEQREEVHEFDMRRARRKERRLIFHQLGIPMSGTNTARHTAAPTMAHSRVATPPIPYHHTTEHHMDGYHHPHYGEAGNHAGPHGPHDYYPQLFSPDHQADYKNHQKPTYPYTTFDPDEYYAEQPGPRYGDIPYYATEPVQPGSPNPAAS